VTLTKEVNREGPMAIILSHVKCPECGLEHAWWTREGWLEEGVEVRPSEDEAA
jgi:hypothetical protein